MGKEILSVHVRATTECLNILDQSGGSVLVQEGL